LSPILVWTRQDNGMAFLRRFLSHHRIFLLTGFALLPASVALAGAPRCVTARSHCPIKGLQPPGTQCTCPDHPDIRGFVDATEMGQPMYPAYQPRGREELRNDDLDDGDDVLAGPRHHHRPHNSRDDEDDE
jgi:hypothetical protein